MKLALLGWNTGIAALLRAIAEDGQHVLVAATEVPQTAMEDLLVTVPGVRVLNDWDELLAEPAADVTLVAGDAETILAGAKQLAVDGRPVALLPQASQGSAFVYELTLTHDDNRVPLVPIPQKCLHPLSERLKAAISEEEFGRLILLRIERSVPLGDRSIAGSAAGLTRDEVDAALLDDAALLRFLGGNYNRITAVHTGSDESGISLATVTLAGEELAEATWSARPGDDDWRLEVTGSKGSATLLLLPDGSGTLEIEREGSGSPERESSDDDGASSGRAQLAAVESSLNDSATHWTEMTRTFETVEATHTSLRRRRTIDLFFETTSERSIFKSQMTAAGCGLIMLTLFGLVAFLLVGAFLDSSSMLQRNAEADNRVVYDTEFVAGSAELNASGIRHLNEIAREAQQSAETILVMPTGDADAEELDQARVSSVVAALSEAGHTESAAFVELASTPHPATLILLNILRILWIAPLVIFLLMQLLVFVTRPSSHEESPDSVNE